MGISWDVTIIHFIELFFLLRNFPKMGIALLFVLCKQWIGLITYTVHPLALKLLNHKVASSTHTRHCSDMEWEEQILPPILSSLWWSTFSSVPTVLTRGPFIVTSKCLWKRSPTNPSINTSLRETSDGQDSYFPILHSSLCSSCYSHAIRSQ